MGQQCVCTAYIVYIYIQTHVHDLTLTYMFLLPQLFLLRPVRQAAGHADGSWWCRQWDVLVWWPAVHGVLGFHCQGEKYFNEVMLFCDVQVEGLWKMLTIQPDIVVGDRCGACIRFYVLCGVLLSDWCLFHRSGSAHLIAHPVTRDPSLSYWLSWSMTLGWVRRLTVCCVCGLFEVVYI